jgi:hypothetical protein
MSTFVYVDPNRSQYGGVLPQGYDGRSSRKPVQRRVVDFTSTVARNLQVCPAPCCGYAAGGVATGCVLTPPVLHTHTLQLRLEQGDGWNDQMLQPVLGAALDVRA